MDVDPVALVMLSCRSFVAVSSEMLPVLSRLTCGVFGPAEQMLSGVIALRGPGTSDWPDSILMTGTVGFIFLQGFWRENYGKEKTVEVFRSEKNLLKLINR